MKYILTYEAFEQPEERDKLKAKKEREIEKDKKKRKKDQEKACKHPAEFRIQLPYGERCQLCKIKLK